jgi:hypothetical protein
MHGETPLTSSSDIPRERIRNEGADQDDQQRSAFGQEGPSQQTDDRQPRQDGSRAREPAIQPRPFDSERLHEESGDGGVERGDRAAANFLSNVGGSAHWLFRGQAFAGTVVARVIVDGVERISGRDRAIEKVGRHDDAAEERGCGRHTGAPKGVRSASIDEQPGERGDDKRQGRYSCQAGRRRRDPEEHGIFARRLAMTPHERPRRKCDGCHEDVVAPAIRRP